MGSGCSAVIGSPTHRKKVWTLNGNWIPDRLAPVPDVAVPGLEPEAVCARLEADAGLLGGICLRRAMNEPRTECFCDQYRQVFAGGRA